MSLLTEEKETAHMRKQPFRKRVWVGICDGRPNYTLIDTGFGGWGNGSMRTIIIFTSKARAKQQYEKVQQFELREVRLPTPRCFGSGTKRTLA